MPDRSHNRRAVNARYYQRNKKRLSLEAKKRYKAKKLVPPPVGG